MSVTISCPECNAKLKLPSRELLGKKGKCPRCQHRFVMAEEEIELQLADPEQPAPAVDEPMMGTSAKWVPDEPAPSPAIPVPSEPNENFNFNFTEPTESAAEPSMPGGGEQVAKGETQNGRTESAASRVRSRRRKRSNTGPIVIGVGTALFAFSLLGLWWSQKDQPKQEQAVAKVQANDAWEDEKQDLASENDAAKAMSPTSGDSIPLKYFPFVPDLVFHLRPSEIWSLDNRNRVFVATLADPGGWLENTIRTVTRFEPQEIEEVTFAINFGPRTSDPDVAAVVRLKSAQQVSELKFERFNGQVRPDLPNEVYESSDYSFMMIDSKTFAVASLTLSDMLADSKDYTQTPRVELESLVKESDRTRHATLLFDVSNIDTHREYIFGESLQQFADKFVLWFGSDVQTVSWSFHLGDDLFMETLVRNQNDSSPLRLQRHLKSQMQKLPGVVQEMARMMQPPTQGRRAMIGRFPAMLQATTLGTSSYVGPSYVRLITFLPGKAAANLAAASVFTWFQSTQTDFSVAPVVATGPTLAERVADRLLMPVIVDFRRMPLQEAFSYIADEIKTPIVINGDALKLAGMTQNMPQTYNLGEVSAVRAIDAMVSNPDYKGMLVIVVDEAKKQITLTTRTVAEEAGMQIFDTSK